ncbi:unnamed protein product [Lepeophtheirus salmonis]|uniref:(salmon louse) hypothetical protein n=1 Tax=Lepeophtheirus salmonis TaxID=72036 RepID=A0A7R8HAH6_LEPSM|nr:unnamed protein product [Lepeophtheirus salmonis]CAF2971559.1 unnamed protein product [Lepeophtheirus salmonis]
MKETFLVTFLLLYSFVIINPCRGHVALVFPPARKYELDFLDAFRTKLHVEWAKGMLGQVFLMDEALIYPGILDIHIKVDRYIGERTSQTYSYSIPNDFVCKDCTIRLIRQALDFGQKYIFQSCADVDIVQEDEHVENCSNRGKFSNGACVCNKPQYYGDRCEFADECASDSDCSGSPNGQCLDLGGTAYPRKQCFCMPGFFGNVCSKKSTLNPIKLSNFTSFKQYSFGTTTNFYWRLLEDESLFEGIITAKTTSYLAVGWRPDGLDKSCHDVFPTDAMKIIGRDFHPMDCLDIVLGAVKNGLSRVGDYYTRDRSTPQLDELFWGQSDDLKAAGGWEENGRTYIRFIKSVSANGGSDQDFYGKVHLAWAHGRNDDSFYRQDEIKYHGKNRGYALIMVGTEPLSNSKITFITSMVLLVAIFILQGAHNVLGTLNTFDKEIIFSTGLKISLCDLYASQISGCVWVGDRISWHLDCLSWLHLHQFFASKFLTAILLEQASSTGCRYCKCITSLSQAEATAALDQVGQCQNGPNYLVLAQSGPFKIGSSFTFPKHNGRTCQHDYFNRHLVNGEKMRRSWLMYSKKEKRLNCICFRFLKVHDDNQEHNANTNTWNNLEVRLEGLTIEKQEKELAEEKRKEAVAVVPSCCCNIWDSNSGALCIG